ncbi:hypothetical protein [Mesorhizobium sp. WSM2239]|uniref:Uncharacterized protein n=2 Tax=unclassified Mesorhizobium TaxID=325217 RepID=A0AAU8D180_9HYPH
MENPYWHEFYKPHVVDFHEVRELCFRAFAIAAASRSMMGVPGEEIGGTLHDAFFRMAEARLSDALLNLAVKIRTFEDIIADSEAADEYAALLKKIFEPEQLGSIGNEGSDGRRDISLRVACNKIIHAEDLRPVYEHGSNPREEDFAWGMTGTIELTGKLRGKQWDVWLEHLRRTQSRFWDSRGKFRLIHCS